MRAIVIGSGIGGLSCALGLRKVGIDVTVYERASELREVGAGIMLWANALRALRELGVWEAVREDLAVATRIQLASKNGYRVQMTVDDLTDMEKQVGFSPVVGFIHRAALVERLGGLLPPGVARYGFECVGLEPRGDRVAVRFANGHEAEADLLVGADGLRSTVRSSLLGKEEPRYAGYACWRGICPRPAGVAPGELRLLTGWGSQVGINPMTGNRVYWFATRNLPRGQRWEDEHAELTRAFRDWAAPLPELIASTPPETVIWADILDRPPARGWAQGRCVLIGDAAHPTTPNFGQGGGMAIEDGLVLARTLVANRADPVAALAAFEAERFPRTSEVTNEAWKFGKLLQWEGRFSVWFRDLLSNAMIKTSGTKNLLKHARYDVGPLTAQDQ